MRPFDNLGGVINLIESELREPAERQAIMGYVRDFLWDVRSQRFLFSDASTSFVTVAGQAAYRFGDGGLPGNVLKIDWLRSLTGSTYNPIRQVTVHEIRAQQGSTTATSQYPSLFAWYGQKLELYPTPSAVTTIKADYQIDPTLDMVSGAPFNEETSVDSFTNEFFREGRSLLVSYVLMRWGLGRGRDAELSQAQGSVYNKTKSRMLQESGKAKWGDGQAVPNW